MRCSPGWLTWLGPEEALAASCVATIEITPQWDDATLAVVQTYLKRDKPETRLRKMRTAADRLRVVIVSRLETNEILWTVNHFRDETDYLF